MTDLTPRKRVPLGPGRRSYSWVRSEQITEEDEAARALAEHEERYQASVQARKRAQARAAKFHKDARLDLRVALLLAPLGVLLFLIPLVAEAIAGPAGEYSDLSVLYLVMKVLGGIALAYGVLAAACYPFDRRYARRIEIPDLYVYDPDDGIYTARAALARVSVSADVRAALTTLESSDD